MLSSINIFGDELAPEALNLPALTPEGTLGMDINKATDRTILDLVSSELYKKIGISRHAIIPVPSFLVIRIVLAHIAMKDKFSLSNVIFFS